MDGKNPWFHIQMFPENICFKLYAHWLNIAHENIYELSRGWNISVDSGLNGKVDPRRDALWFILLQAKVDASKIFSLNDTELRIDELKPLPTAWLPVVASLARLPLRATRATPSHGESESLDPQDDQQHPATFGSGLGTQPHCLWEIHEPKAGYWRLKSNQAGVIRYGRIDQLTYMYLHI